MQTSQNAPSLISKDDAFRKKVQQSIKEAGPLITPAWDIRDFVAVNPFFGHRDQSFLKALRYVEAATGETLLPHLHFFKQKWDKKEILGTDLIKALEQYSLETQQKEASKITFDFLLKTIHEPSKNVSALQIKSLSDYYDSEQSTGKTTEVVRQVSKWASAYFDETQALWKMPLKEKRFFYAWKTLAQYDSRGSEGEISLHSVAKNLPKDPVRALEVLVQQLEQAVPLLPQQLTNYFFRLLSSVQGWSSYFRKFEFEAERTNDFTQIEKMGTLVDLLAVRMAYDIVYLKQISNLEDFGNQLHWQESPKANTASQYIWLLALENAYRREVLSKMSAPQRPAKTTPPQAQMVFCIDVRSEVMRRNIEHVMPQGVTLGFAGFFGLPISTKGLGHKSADQQCPVLLNAVAEIEEVSMSLNTAKVAHQRFYQAMKTHFKKKIQSSTSSCFTFVEVLGLTYLLNLLHAASGRSPNLQLNSLGLTKNQEKDLAPNTTTLDQNVKNQFALGALKNMGLTENFAPIVIFFGHGSSSANNPYASGLDCGACAGHHGLNNARVLADLLNDETVRVYLRQKDILIPEQTLFVSGWHNTTVDTLQIDVPRKASNIQLQQILEIEESLKIASHHCQKERAKDLDFYSDAEADLQKKYLLKANDWSDTRPEWGLARNAAFIVGSRELTKNINLKGRSFLHEYDAQKDHDLSVLELIMTAPMIVTNWINMQYYASTVSPSKFGSGNKVLHNVVGGIGCVLGNSSDLLGGLSEQSVLYKGEYYHEPLRLQVFLQAEPQNIDRIISKHAMVRDLVVHGWLRLISIHPSTNEAKLLEKIGWAAIGDSYLQWH